MQLSRRALMGTGALALGAALTARSAAFAQAAAPAEPLATIADVPYVLPELRPGAVLMLNAPGSPMTVANIASKRRQGPAPAPAATPPVEQRVIAGRNGAPDVVIYVINAAPGAAKPAILHTHGGGYVLGDPEGDLPGLQRTASTLDCVIVTVKYRLAPETTYVGSIEDNYAGLLWLYQNAASLGADPKRIALMGESAGGGHAALLALTARDRGEVPIIFQALVYPMLDDRTGVTQNPASPIGKILWTPEKNRFGWHSFLGQAPGTAKVPTRAVPARYKSLAGLPPTWIGVGAIDLFVDEDIEYARRLVNAGVSTELIVTPGAYHGFDGIARDTAPAKAFTASKLEALRRAFNPAV